MVRRFQVLDIGVERCCEVAVKVGGRALLQHVSDPRLALECLKAQVPNARRKTGGRNVSELIGLRGLRDKDMVMEFVLVGPIVEKDEIGGAALVNAKEAETVVVKVGRQRAKMLRRDALGCCHQLRARLRTGMSNAVELDAPIVHAPEVEESDWTWLVRSHSE
jgi:hypothetical protein